MSKPRILLAAGLLAVPLVLSATAIAAPSIPAFTTSAAAGARRDIAGCAFPY